MSIIAVGSSPRIDSLMLLGFDVVKVPEKMSKEVEDEVLSRILGSKAVFIEGEIYRALSKRMKEILSVVQEPPLIVVVPGSGRGETYRLEELYNMISLAVGVQLKWRK